MNSCLYFIKTDFLCRNNPSWDSHDPESVALECLRADYNQEQSKLTWLVSYSTFKYMKLRRKDRSIICCPIGYPPPLSVSESTPALSQALEYSLEGLRPKTWAEEIYPPSRNLPAEPFQKPGLSCSANLMLQCGENSVLPQPGAGCQSVMYLYIIIYH